MILEADDRPLWTTQSSAAWITEAASFASTRWLGDSLGGITSWVAALPKFEAFSSTLPMLQTDWLSEALGHTIDVHQRLEIMGSLPNLQAAYPAMAAGPLDFLGELGDLNDVMASQLFALARLPEVTLARPVALANRAWHLGATSKFIKTVRSAALLDLGHSVRAVNNAAYILDAVDDVDQGWVSSDPGAVPSGDERQSELDDMLNWIDGVDRRLTRKYQGARFAIDRRGPDWMSQAANSTIELIDWFLRALASDDDVLGWQRGHGQFASEVGKDGRPHRILRVRFIASQRGISAAAAQEQGRAVTQLVRKLQAIKHADDDTMASAAHHSVIATERFLRFMWRGQE